MSSPPAKARWMDSMVASSSMNATAVGRPRWPRGATAAGGAGEAARLIWRAPITGEATEGTGERRSRAR